MMSKKPVTKMGKGATLIAENTAVTGDVRFSDQLYVNGHIEGNVLAEAGTDATLMISDVGSVKGQINAPFVVVNGRVEGDVHAGTRVELRAARKDFRKRVLHADRDAARRDGRRPTGARPRRRRTEEQRTSTAASQRRGPLKPVFPVAFDPGPDRSR